MANTWPVVAYPEGEKAGKVVSGKRGKAGKVRHVGYSFTRHGSVNRLGTFETHREAKDAVIEEYRRVTS